MKKLLSMIIVAAMVFSTFVAFAPASGAAVYGYQPGDANDDADVNMKDVLLTRKYVAGLEAERDINVKAANVYEDDYVDQKDVLRLRRVIAGLEELDENNEDGKYKVDAVSIGDRNISRYTVVLPSDADPCVKNASGILVDRINRACGYKLNVTSDETAVTGCKIKFIHDNDSEYELGKDGFKIEVTDDGDLDIVCAAAGHQRGAVYSVYHLLEEFVGYRFFISDSFGVSGEQYGDTVYLYPSQNAVIPDGYCETVSPSITFRQMAQNGISPSNFAWLHLNEDFYGMNEEYGWREGVLFINAHSYAYQMAGPEHCYDAAWIDEAGLHKTQPCLTDEETYDKIMLFSKWLIDDRASWSSPQLLGESYTQLSVSPNDNTNFCTCENCKAVYDAEGAISGTVFRLSNRVAEDLDELYPGIQIQTIAYWDARRPPKYTCPRENVCVVYCIGGCNNHPYDHTELCAAAGGNERLQVTSWGTTATTNSSNVDDIAFYKAWTELTDNVEIWYYSCNYNFFLAPAANLFNVYNDIKFLADNGTRGVIFEGSSLAKYCFENLRGYLGTRMMWNPRMTEKEYNDLMNEYLWIYYGEGWKYIREYIDMSNRAGDLEGCWTNNYDRPWNLYNEEYFKDHYKEMAVLFDKAYEAAESAAQRSRVLDCRMQCDFLGLSATYERDWVNGDAAARAEYKARYVHLHDYIVENGVLVTLIEPSTPTGCRNFPADTEDEHIINTMEWLYEGSNGRWNYVAGRWQ